MDKLLRFTDEIVEAQQQNAPIVALESTIISHGMPYPQNIETAIACEKIIREEGAVPATIALFDGKIQVGFDEKLFDHFGRDNNIQKASLRDMAFYLSQKVSASTTVAATLKAAHLASLSFFATGGIGGVHRGAEAHFDISTDLMALGSTPLLVVAAGAKAILDIPKTLEVLETQGVPVIGFGTNAFPAFYSQKSPYPVPLRLDSIEDIVALYLTQQKLKLNKGVFVATPIPKEAEIPFETIAPVIEKACQASDNIQGKALTPHLLKAITEMTQGESLKANIALIKNNARLCARLAIEYAKLNRQNA